MKRLFGLSLFTRASDRSLVLASYHPRSSSTWHWSVSIAPRNGNAGRAPHRTGQWHDFYPLPFGKALIVSRQDYHKGGLAR